VPVAIRLRLRPDRHAPAGLAMTRFVVRVCSNTSPLRRFPASCLSFPAASCYLRPHEAVQQVHQRHALPPARPAGGAPDADCVSGGPVLDALCSPLPHPGACPDEYGIGVNAPEPHHAVPLRPGHRESSRGRGIARHHAPVASHSDIGLPPAGGRQLRRGPADPAAAASSPRSASSSFRLSRTPSATSNE
jgi:hypothetical protein